MVEGGKARTLRRSSFRRYLILGAGREFFASVRSPLRSPPNIRKPPAARQAAHARSIRPGRFGQARRPRSFRSIIVRASVSRWYPFSPIPTPKPCRIAVSRVVRSRCRRRSTGMALAEGDDTHSGGQPSLALARGGEYEPSQEPYCRKPEHSGTSRAMVSSWDCVRMLWPASYSTTSSRLTSSPFDPHRGAGIGKMSAFDPRTGEWVSVPRSVWRSLWVLLYRFKPKIVMCPLGLDAKRRTIFR